jgi:DNA excision repair protein ERCC-4
VLIMTSSTISANLIGEFLSGMDPDAPRGSQGRQIMLSKLRKYLWWKSKLEDEKQAGKPSTTLSGKLKDSGDANQREEDASEGLSEALKKKDREKAQRLASRRRMRGGAPSSVPPTSVKSHGTPSQVGNMANRASQQAESMAVQ